MYRYKILFAVILTFSFSVITSQVKVRLFSGHSPESVVYSVIDGKYELNLFNGEILNLIEGEPVIITRYNGKLAVKKRDSEGFVCDSVFFKAKTGDGSFSLRINGKLPVRQYYYGDLKCFPDMETVVLINTCNIEKYISGVVKAEGGSGKNKEYFKTQAVIARTYMYKYFDKHMSDRYNVCDNTHCQAFNGLSYDTIINSAVLETQGLVILDRDSSLIISAFHSNCGGETSSSEDVWLSGKSYLKKVVDPYCLSSRNAVWEKRIRLPDWYDYIKKHGFNGGTGDPSVFNFRQTSRSTNYITGSFTIPLSTIRTELNLRSTFFSVQSAGDYIILRGRGYGHGVGLCQEGAMVMAANGLMYEKIINFYYNSILISDIKNAVVLSPDFRPQTP